MCKVSCFRMCTTFLVVETAFACTEKNGIRETLGAFSTNWWICAFVNFRFCLQFSSCNPLHTKSESIGWTQQKHCSPWLESLIPKLRNFAKLRIWWSQWIWNVGYSSFTPQCISPQISRKQFVEVFINDCQVKPSRTTLHAVWYNSVIVINGTGQSFVKPFEAAQIVVMNHRLVTWAKHLAHE